MTDWNPAEIIGTNPKPLALSLYKYLITDKNWSLARKKMGYKFENSPNMSLYFTDKFLPNDGSLMIK